MLLPRVLAAPLVLALLPGLTACASQPGSADRPRVGHEATGHRYEGTAADFAAIRRVLADRASAVLHDDRAAFLATVDPGDHDFVARQRTLFANLQQLPVASMSYTLEDVGIPRRDLGRGPQLSPPVVEYVALHGADVRPVSNPLVDVFVRRHHRWLLASETEHVFNQTTDVQSRPWGGGPVDVARRGNTVVVTDAGTRAPRLLGRISRALAAVRAVLGRRAGPHLLVDATSTGVAQRFSALSHEDAAAVTFPVHMSARSGVGPDRLAGLVVKINPHRLRGGLGQYGLLRHELTHVTLFAESKGLPVWLSEGMADYVAFHPYPESALVVAARVRQRLDRMARHPALPESSQFDYDPAENYALSHAAVLWLADRYGVPRLLSLVDAYHRAFRSTDLVAADTRMLRRVFGITARQLAVQAFRVTRQLQVR